MADTKSEFKSKSKEQVIYDIVVFGATGFTGQLVVEYLARKQSKFRWAIAGRNIEKLRLIKHRLTEISPLCKDVGIIEADVDHQESLNELAQKAKVVITTVGPYITYGEPLVKACVEHGCHYVDLTGEPEFVDTVRHNYHQKAQDKKIKIVNSCGFDSIPYDLGALYTINHLKRLFPEEQRDSIDVEMECFFRSSGSFSGGTWHSVVTIFSRTREYGKKRKQWQLADQSIHRAEREDAGKKTKVSKLPTKVSFKKSLGTWALPMPTIDPVVVRRSATIRGDYGGTFKYGHYIQMKKFSQLAALAVGAAGVFGLAQFKPTRNLLFKVKSPGDGPTEAERNKAWFKIIMQATANGQTVHSHISGGDPGYSETAKMLSESALCLAFDDEQLPKNYGVVTPSAAMGESLLERLQSEGIKFEIDYSSSDAADGESDAA